MKRYIVEAYRPHVYMIKADNPQQARRKAVARWQRTHHKRTVEPKVAVVTEARVGLSFWDSVDAAIDEYKDRLYGFGHIILQSHRRASVGASGPLVADVGPVDRGASATRQTASQHPLPPCATKPTVLEQCNPLNVHMLVFSP